MFTRFFADTREKKRPNDSVVFLCNDERDDTYFLVLHSEKFALHLLDKLPSQSMVKIKTFRSHVHTIA